MSVATAVAEKYCHRCEASKPVEAFSRCSGKRDGLSSNCKECCKEQLQAWRRANPERIAVLNERWRKQHPERARNDALLHKQRHPGKVRARKAVEYALHTGELVRPEACEDCGGLGREYKDGRAGIQGHHSDYSKPLEVEWLCEDCHVERHA